MAATLIGERHALSTRSPQATVGSLVGERYRTLRAETRNVALRNPRFHGGDRAYGGAYRITGTAQRQGVPCQKRVRLYSRRTGLLIRETRSLADGSFSFDRIALSPDGSGLPGGYVVMELDDLSYDPWFDPACADRVTPESMP